MSRRYGRYRCSYGTWHDLDDTCTCPTPTAVLAAAFPAPGRIAGSFDVHCWTPGCECKAWAIPDENRRVA
jgi:hypothetical protein